MRLQHFDFFFQGFLPIVDSTHVRTLTSLQYFGFSTVVWLEDSGLLGYAGAGLVFPCILKEYSAFETS